MDRQALLEAFRTAIDGEEDAARVYTVLAEQADDLGMKRLLGDSC